MQTILIIEDEPELVRVLRTYLEGAGFEVLAAYRGDTGLATWDNRHPDAVILDLNLPGMDGLDVAREIRRKSLTPILMLTARVEETDQLIGLELGADDYVTKPYSPRVVVSRIRALLRRARGAAAEEEVIRAANLEIDLGSMQVSRADQVIELTPTEFNLLAGMARQPGRVFTRAQLLELAQGHSYVGYERTIDVHIKNQRAKIEMEPGKPRYIETVFGVGYRFTRTME
jgi:two-component system alkaline phosphatase synthesis response regulator PhoP